MPTNHEIVIVEDSPAVTMLLKGFLEKLGYGNIHACSNGKTAVEVFAQLHAEGKNIIVLLDFKLPDMDANTILNQILSIQSDARVILETATDEDDPGVQELIRNGIYEYIQKPLRFEKLKEIFETLEDEQGFFEKESNQIRELEKATENALNIMKEHIEFLFKSYKQISIIMIKDVLGYSEQEVDEYIQHLISQNKIIKLEDKRELVCNECGSVKKSQIFFCPSCKNSNFKMGKIIEHHPCGNISEENDYVDDKCPSCKKDLKALGVDYRVMKNHYICKNCKEVFPKISTHYLCLNCENKYTLDEAKWKISPYYKAINM